MKQEQSEAEATPEQIANYIYKHPPQKANFYNLQLEDQLEEQIQKTTSQYAKETGIDKFIQSILSHITLAGIKVLYGHDDWVTLSQDQQTQVRLYTRSYGYDYKIVVESFDETTDKYMIVFSKIYELN